LIEESNRLGIHSIPLICDAEKVGSIEIGLVLIERVLLGEDFIEEFYNLNLKEITTLWKVNPAKLLTFYRERISTRNT
jgi:hypothetical protein